LSRDALSQTPVSTVEETARGMRAHLGPQISASTPREAGAERKEFPIPWFTFASGTLYGGCNGCCSIGFSGDGSFQIQVLAALVVRIP